MLRCLLRFVLSIFLLLFFIDLLQFSLTKSALYATSKGTYKDSHPLANITILGVQETISYVTFNGGNIRTGCTYDRLSKVLNIEGLAKLTSAGAWTNDWVLKWA